MGQSAVVDALLIASDALQDGRLADCERVLAEVDAMGAWDFECWPTEPKWDLSLLTNGASSAGSALTIADLVRAQEALQRQIAEHFGIAAWPDPRSSSFVMMEKSNADR